jgi:hypothetical protein
MEKSGIEEGTTTACLLMSSSSLGSPASSHSRLIFKKNMASNWLKKPHFDGTENTENPSALD